MDQELSAGVALFRRTQTQEREFLILHYGAGHWDFPKGHIESGESALQAARRELREETGIAQAGFLKGFREIIRYYYTREGSRVRKIVIYFLAETTTPEVTLSDEHTGYAWLPYEETLRMLTFRNSRQVLARAREFLDSATKTSAPPGGGTTREKTPTAEK